MKNVSNAFKKVIKDGGPFYAYAKVTLSNGTQLELNPRMIFTFLGIITQNPAKVVFHWELLLPKLLI